MPAYNFPTRLHAQATAVVRDFFAPQAEVDTILLVNSLARGKAVAESDIDLAILVSETVTPAGMQAVEQRWFEFSAQQPILSDYRNANKFAQIHLDVINGEFEPVPWEPGGAIDYFEVEIGNRLVYAAPLTGEGAHFKKLQARWLPYYEDALRAQRLHRAHAACAADLERVTLALKREMYFYAFDLLYKAFQEFLQALFIKYKTYPIAYNKWIQEQVVEILRMPELYVQLPPILSVNNLASEETSARARTLHSLLDKYC